MSDRVVIVGAGITGLAAAHEAQRRDHDVTVLEAADRAGGKIDGGPIADTELPFAVDAAADGFLTRQPEMVELCRELGLGDDLVAPEAGGAFIWADGALRAIPRPSVLGVPVDADAVAASGIVSEAGVADFRRRVVAEASPLVGDAGVGEALRPRLGDEVFERLVDPLLGGINAGNADGLSIEAGAEQLARVLRAGGSLRAALLDHIERAVPAGPVFNGVRGGNQRIIQALADRLGHRLHLGRAATAVRRDDSGWTVDTEAGPVAADRVILTTPGWITAGLLAPLAPDAASTLADLAYADAVLVTFVVPRDRIEHPLDGSGFLVPRSEGLLMTACSWSSSKWAHYDDGTHAVLRVSAGRTDDVRWLGLEPDELVARLTDELTSTLGLRGEAITRISPWRRSLPQYRAGHLERCDEIDAELAGAAPGLVVTGAQMRGLGLPACVRQGRAAVG